MSFNTPLISTETDEKIVDHQDPEPNDERIEETNSYRTDLDQDSIDPSLPQSHSPQTIISTILDTVITEIESNKTAPLNSLPIIEDDQIENDEDEEDEEENDEEEEEEDAEEQENSDKPSANKSSTIEKDRSTSKSSPLKLDLKPTTRTLRSHARKKFNLSSSNSMSSSNSNNNIRRVSNRRRALENKLLLAANEKEKKRRSISERSKKEKDNVPTNEEIQTSSNSDDQTMETTNGINFYKLFAD